LVSFEQMDIITSYPKCKKALDMIKGILYLNGLYCCRCNKSLSRTEVMECNGCHRMAYCSRACQKEDWLNGHSLTCCCSPTVKTIGQFQGRVLPEEVPSDERAAAKLQEIEINTNMIQLKLFLDNSEAILDQAKGLGIPLHDCIVAFDLSQCPPALKIEKHTAAFSSQDNIEGFEESRSKDNIMCVYQLDICIGKRKSFVAMQRHSPHEWLKKQSE